MAEPHQRTQSGKLKPVARKTINDAEVSSIQKIQPVTIGIEDANNVKIENADDVFHDIIGKYSNYTLEKSTCSAIASGTGYQIKGRWSLHAVTELRSLGIIKKEPTEAKNITLRMRNPRKANDGSQLSITTTGWLQFNGRPDNVAQLYGEFKGLAPLLCKFYGS